MTLAILWISRRFVQISQFQSGIFLSIPPPAQGSNFNLNLSWPVGKGFGYKISGGLFTYIYYYMGAIKIRLNVKLLFEKLKIAMSTFFQNIYCNSPPKESHVTRIKVNIQPFCQALSFHQRKMPQSSLLFCWGYWCFASTTCDQSWVFNGTLCRTMCSSETHRRMFFVKRLLFKVTGPAIES